MTLDEVKENFYAMNGDALEYAKLNEDRARESIQTLLDSDYDDDFLYTREYDKKEIFNSLMRDWENNHSDIEELKELLENNKWLFRELIDMSDEDTAIDFIKEQLNW